MLRMVERVMTEGDARAGVTHADLSPGDARALLGAWLDAVGLDMPGRDLIAYMQSADFSHGALMRRSPL